MAFFSPVARTGFLKRPIPAPRRKRLFRSVGSQTDESEFPEAVTYIPSSDSVRVGKVIFTRQEIAELFAPEAGPRMPPVPKPRLKRRHPGDTLSKSSPSIRLPTDPAVYSVPDRNSKHQRCVAADSYSRKDAIDYAPPVPRKTLSQSAVHLSLKEPHTETLRFVSNRLGSLTPTSSLRASSPRPGQGASRLSAYSSPCGKTSSLGCVNCCYHPPGFVPAAIKHRVIYHADWEKIFERARRSNAALPSAEQQSPGLGSLGLVPMSRTKKIYGSFDFSQLSRNSSRNEQTVQSCSCLGCRPFSRPNSQLSSSTKARYYTPSPIPVK